MNRGSNRIGIFGGTFDPPHLGHLLAAEFAFEVLHLDRMLWIPASTPPNKQSHDLSAPEHRLAMTALSIEGDTRFELSDVEIKRGGVSYSIDTLQELRSTMPDSEIFLFIGMDQLHELESWKSYESIYDVATVVALARPGAPKDGIAASLKDRTRILDIPLIDISSSTIRERARERKNIRYMVRESVADYIQKQKLYT